MERGYYAKKLSAERLRRVCPVDNASLFCEVPVPNVE